MPDQRRLPVLRKSRVHGHVVALVNAREDVADVSLHRLRRNAMRLVVGHLLLPAAVRLGDGAFHAARHLVGVKDDLSIHVARGAPYRLDQRRFRAQKAFLVRIQNGDQRDLRNVQPLAQEVNADQHVERAESKVADDFNALQCVHIGVHITHLESLLVGVLGQSSAIRLVSVVTSTL